MKLTEKQKRFADYYIQKGNSTEAAIKAGYSKKTARFIASENLTKPNIKEYIDKHLEKLQSERIADQHEILEFLTSIVRGDKTEQTLALAGNGTQDVTDIDVSAKDRLKAAELLGKRYGIWTENINMESKVEIIDNIPKSDTNESN